MFRTWDEINGGKHEAELMAVLSTRELEKTLGSKRYSLLCRAYPQLLNLSPNSITENKLFDILSRETEMEPTKFVEDTNYARKWAEHPQDMPLLELEENKETFLLKYTLSKKTRKLHIPKKEGVKDTLVTFLATCGYHSSPSSSDKKAFFVYDPKHESSPKRDSKVKARLQKNLEGRVEDIVTMETKFKYREQIKSAVAEYNVDFEIPVLSHEGLIKFLKGLGYEEKKKKLKKGHHAFQIQKGGFVFEITTYGVNGLSLIEIESRVGKGDFHKSMETAYELLRGYGVHPSNFVALSQKNFYSAVNKLIEFTPEDLVNPFKIFKFINKHIVASSSYCPIPEKVDTTVK